MEVNGITPDETHGIESREPLEGEVAAEPAVIRKRSRKRSITIFVVVSVLNVALLVLLWTQLLTPSQQASSDSNNTNSATIGNYNSPLLGKSAPDLTIVKPDGGVETMRLSSFKGKPVMLNFWASWCGPCNDEAPFLQRNVPKLQAQGVTFLGIDAPEKASDAQAFIKKYGINYTNVQDTLNGSTAIDYGVTTFPVTVFINREGVISGMWRVQLNDQALKTELAKITS